jgi:tetratricopeptide (TPR) repeat protein
MVGLRRFASSLALLGMVASAAAAGDGDDLRALVEGWRGGDAAAAEAEIARWSLPRARAASRGVAKAERWPDPHLLAAALLFTHAGKEEIRAHRGPGNGWFDLARKALGKSADEAAQRRWRRDWALSLGAFHAGRYDGRRARDVLDQAVRDFPDDPEVLFEAGRLHEAIGARFSSGLGEPLPADLASAVAPDLVAAADLYERVLALQPDRHAARLRRGRVLALLERPGAARPELVAARGASADPDVVMLAHLFLGAVAEREGHGDGALTAYRSAAGSEAGAFALAHALERRGDSAAAREAVLEVLGAGDPGSASDAWWRYRAGGLGEMSGEAGRVEALRQEARR